MNIQMPLMLKINDHISMGLFPGFLFGFIDLCVSLGQQHNVLWYISIVSLEIRYCESFNFVLLFQDCFGFSSSIAFIYQL